MDFIDYYIMVADLAIADGFREKEVLCFKGDIHDHYFDGKTPEEAYRIEFGGMTAEEAQGYI